MQIPMRLKEERTIHSGCASRDQVKDRLDRWAARYGFTSDHSGIDDLTFQRGSHWKALYTFDIRKIPTVVRIEFSLSEVGQVTCRIQCGSWLQFSTLGDQKRLSEQLDLLEACLKGVLS
jgi:hypothetical protein